ncbi:hypothetical protein NKJ40_26520 [Mesorhizobium sp. M0119]|uniref:hypothetical protein n=1 Tax=unclassified Mesorhizobium TaxID=325217 RepID=UPI003339B022
MASLQVSWRLSSILAPHHESDDTIDFRSIDDSWHNTFCKMLTENVPLADVGNVFANVSFVTFNYDRCIEHYVVQSLRNYFRLSRQDAEAVAKTLTIIHPYGQVGLLPWQVSGGVPYGARPHHTNLPDIAGQVRTFTERIDDDAIIKRMHRVIAEAEVVVYLGFSYGDMNMQLLTLDGAGERRIFGTSLGISEPNKKVVENDILNSMGPDYSIVESIELADLTCNDFLNAYWRPILRG